MNVWVDSKLRTFYSRCKYINSAMLQIMTEFLIDIKRKKMLSQVSEINVLNHFSNWITKVKVPMNVLFSINYIITPMNVPMNVLFSINCIITLNLFNSLNFFHKHSCPFTTSIGTILQYEDSGPL